MKQKHHQQKKRPYRGCSVDFSSHDKRISDERYDLHSIWRESLNQCEHQTHLTDLIYTDSHHANRVKSYPGSFPHATLQFSGEAPHPAAHAWEDEISCQNWQIKAQICRYPWIGLLRNNSAPCSLSAEIQIIDRNREADEEKVDPNYKSTKYHRNRSHLFQFSFSSRSEIAERARARRWKEMTNQGKKKFMEKKMSLPTQLRIFIIYEDKYILKN